MNSRISGVGTPRIAFEPHSQIFWRRYAQNRTVSANSRILASAHSELHSVHMLRVSGVGTQESRTERERAHSGVGTRRIAFEPHCQTFWHRRVQNHALIEISRILASARSELHWMHNLRHSGDGTPRIAL